MNISVSKVLMTFVSCVFFGVTIGSFALGAIWPPVNLLAKPFVCANGQMQELSQDYTVSPVEGGTTITWYCTDSQTGVKNELGIFPMGLFTGTILGTIAFVFIFAIMVIRALTARPAQQYG